mgnify:FL=1
MKNKERKQREKKIRKQQILDAAEDVIFSKGIDQATMDEIAELAELSKGTLYLYFKNKSDLYLAVSLRGSDKLHKKFADVLTSDLTGMEMLQKMGTEYIDFVKNNPGYYNSFVYFETLCSTGQLTESRLADDCERSMEEGFRYMTRALQIGMQDGTIDDHFDPGQLAIQIWGSVRGLIQLCHMERSGFPVSILENVDMELESIVGHFIQLFLRGIKPESDKVPTD